MKRSTRFAPAAACLLVTLEAAACGKRGNPMAPIRPVPAAPASVSARRVGDHVRLQFNIPTENTDRTAPPVISRVEIYAAAGPPAVAPPAPMSIPPAVLSIPINNAPVAVASAPLALSRFPPVQLAEPAGMSKKAASKAKPATTPAAIMTKKYLRGQIEVRPAPPEAGAAPPEATPPPAPKPPADDSRPQPGATATFAEDVTAARAAAAQSPDASILRYVVVGVAGGKRLGAPSPILEIPLTTEAVPPRDPTVTYDETTVKLAWTPAATAQVFRVYASDAQGKEQGPPLHAGGLTTPTFSMPVEFGAERCFIVRSLFARGGATVESEAAGPACVKPVDTFPPPAPSGLSSLPTETQVQLLWAPVAAPDLAGYLVLRSDDGSKPEPLMTQPIVETSYTDAKVRTGVHYTYVVVAVDKAGNRSQPSNQIDEIR